MDSGPEHSRGRAVVTLAIYLLVWPALFFLHGLAAVLLWFVSCALVLGNARRRCVSRVRWWRTALLLLLAWPVYLPYHVLRYGPLLWEPPVRRARAASAIVVVVVAFLLIDILVPLQDGYSAIAPMDTISEAGTLSQEARKERVMEALSASSFRPAWWLRNAHAQTFWGPLTRKRGGELPLRHERWETPDDDFLNIYFYDGEADKPMVLLLHGLEGSRDSFYIKGYNRLFHAIGWNVAVMEFRTCGGEINLAPRAYHMGETTDVDYVARRLAAQFPEQHLYVAGVSLGGNVVAKWLGEEGRTLPPQIRGGAVVSPPFDPAAGAVAFHQQLGGLYVQNFMKTLVPKALAKAEQFPDKLDVEAIMACKDFYCFDTVVTAALHGYDDAEDYWAKVGCHQFLEHIRVPTMLLTSADDPFNPGETIPRAIADASPWLHPQWTERGGHVAFVTGATPRRARYWGEEQTVRFFELYESMSD